jgi:hypothetical protein
MLGIELLLVRPPRLAPRSEVLGVLALGSSWCDSSVVLSVAFWQLPIMEPSTKVIKFAYLRLLFDVLFCCLDPSLPSLVLLALLFL